jgi:hypothetical protein
VSQFCITGRLDCNLIEAMSGLFSMARTVVSSAKVADLVSDEVVAVNIVVVQGHCFWVCLHEWRRVQCTPFQF